MIRTLAAPRPSLLTRLRRRLAPQLADFESSREGVALLRRSPDAMAVLDDLEHLPSMELQRNGDVVEARPPRALHNLLYLVTFAVGAACALRGATHLREPLFIVLTVAASLLPDAFARTRVRIDGEHVEARRFFSRPFRPVPMHTIATAYEARVNDGWAIVLEQLDGSSRVLALGRLRHADVVMLVDEIRSRIAR